MNSELIDKAFLESDLVSCIDYDVLNYMECLNKFAELIAMTTLEEIAEWFRRAVPEPTKTNISVQVGCHFEEVAEFAAAVGNRWVANHLDGIAGDLKYEKPEIRVDPVPALDALCDQIVTAIGVAHMCGWDILGALAEVNRSNWSKFVEGAPRFDASGKIAKGPGYAPPDLVKFTEQET